MTETWRSAKCDEAKTVELEPSGFGVKSFQRQSRSLGGGIAPIYKSILGSNTTFKTNFDFTHTSFEVVQASITPQYNTRHFFCLYRPQPNRRNNLTDYVYWTAAWPSWLHTTSQDLSIILVTWISTLTIHNNHQPNRLWLLLVYITFSKSLVKPLICAVMSLTGLPRGGLLISALVS